MISKQVTESFNAVSEKAIALQRAFDLFDQLADRTDIAFGYTVDGCYASTHIMCRALIDADVNPKKAWAFEGKDQLRVLKQNGIRSTWDWHVAPALAVVMPDGNVQDLVIDPALFDGPVTLKEWGGIMLASSDKIHVARFGEPPAGYIGDYKPLTKSDANTDADAREIMDAYLETQSKDIRVVFPSAVREKYMTSTELPCGKTWVSAPKSVALEAEKKFSDRYPDWFGV